MSDLNLTVQQIQDFQWNSDTLFAKVIAFDMDNLTADVYYELSDSTTNKDPEIYVWREWLDKGVIRLPLSIIASWKNPDGSPNADVINAVIANFHLELIV